MQYAKVRVRGVREEENAKGGNKMIKVIIFCRYYYLIKLVEKKMGNTPR